MTVPFTDLVGMHASDLEMYESIFRGVLSSGRFVGGEEVDRFEDQFAQFCGAKSCVGVANGTDALELVLTALGIGLGDEVIVPANTFIATAAAVVRVGATVRFVDVLPGTLLIDPDAVAAAVIPRTAAIIAVHLFGQIADMERLESVAVRAGIPIVEDAAQAHGARRNGRRAGSIGVAGAFSFYPGKNLGAMGDGGAVVTSDTALAARIRCLADHGRSMTDRNIHVAIGRNSRLDALQAAILRHKLADLDEQNRHRSVLARRYGEQLPKSMRPLDVAPGSDPVFHLYVAQGDQRELLTARLDADKIGWGVHYPVPCHRQPTFDEPKDSYPVAERAARSILSLPVGPTLEARDVDVVCASLSGAALR